MPPGKFLAFRSSEILIKVAISFSMTRRYSFQKLLADLGINVTTLAKHCSYRPMAL